MSIDILINKGDKIQSKRTGTILECYNISPVFIGSDNRIIRYEYSFWNPIKRKCKTFKQFDLKLLLTNAWQII